MKYVFYLIVVLCALAALNFCNECGTVKFAFAADTKAPQRPLVGDVVIDFLGSSMAFVEPCGCHTGQFGGVARWATFLKQSRAEHPAELALFAGGARSTPSTDNDNPTFTLWESYGEMGFDAATVSTDDVADVPRLPAGIQPRLVAANLMTQNGHAIEPAVLYKTMKTSAGVEVRVAMIGVIGDPPFGTAPSPKNSPKNLPFKVTDPSDAVAAVMPEARKNADIVIVMVGGIRQSALDIIQAVPGIDVVVVGRATADTVSEKTFEKVGSTYVLQNTDRGRFAGHFGMTLDKDKHITSTDIQMVPMDDSQADDPAAAALVKTFRAKQVTEVTRGPQEVATGKSEWAGSYACATCHTVEFQQWQGTRHAAAMETLEMKDDGQPAKRRDCVVCHTVAFEKPGGYFIQTPLKDLRGVGCEDCHGAAAGHVRARLQQDPDTSKLVLHPTKQVCQTCHNPDNSPNFDYDTWLPHVLHHPATAAAGGTAAKG